jgi:hypothetical protein
MELSDEQKKRILEEEQQRLAEEQYRAQVRSRLSAPSQPTLPKAALLAGGILAVGIVATFLAVRAYHEKPSESNSTGDINATAPAPEVTAPAHATSEVPQQHRKSERTTSIAPPSSSPCPIKKVHPGMLLEDVRTQLAGYAMDFRGSRQDEDVYYVQAGVCHALLGFNSQNRGLDYIDYGEGWNKIEFRRR